MTIDTIVQTKDWILFIKDYSSQTKNNVEKNECNSEGKIKNKHFWQETIYLLLLLNAILLLLYPFG